MIIRHICQRCRKVVQTVEYSGAFGQSERLRMGMSSADRKMHHQCGGWIYAVNDGQFFPPEFHLTGWRTAFVVVASALFWASSSSVSGMLAVDTRRFGELQAPEIEVFAAASTVFFLRLSLLGTLVWCILALASVLRIRRRPDLDKVIPGAPMTAGELSATFQMGILGIIAGIIVMLSSGFLIGDLGILLRSPFLLILIGMMQGAVGGILSCNALFYIARGHYPFGLKGLSGDLS